VVLYNNRRKLEKICAIGQGLKVKINANVGATKMTAFDREIEKIKTAIECGADTIMDLSVGNNLSKIRQTLLQNCPRPLGTVPIYQAASYALTRKKNFEAITFDDIWDVLNQQAQEGVDFFTIHAGILKKSLALLKQKKRICGVVSRGGAILTHWMLKNQKENPFYANFDKILDLAKAYNITLSLGDALRPGSIIDSTDNLQIGELKVLGELVKRCRQKGVQAMVEGPGHVPLNQIASNMILEKKLCYGAPFYVLGPLPTDIAAGYDHISGAIGGAIAALNGADFLCVVTPAEHLRHPSIEDIREGVIASKIAAHCVDLLRFPDELKRDKQLSLYRAKRDWHKQFEFLLDKQKAKHYRGGQKSTVDKCTMCSDFCSLKVIDNCGFLY
jgi:phosphomethylpyrimidine synthase